MSQRERVFHGCLLVFLAFLIFTILTGIFVTLAKGEPYIEKSGPEGERRGVVLLVHGGMWLGGINGVRSTDEHRDRYLDWGWGVWAIDYASGRDSIRDVKVIYDELAASTGKPICASGQSAGGHLSLLLADQREFECVISEGGPTDLEGVREIACWAWCPDLARFSPENRGDVAEEVLLGQARQDAAVPPSLARRYEEGRTDVRLTEIDPGPERPFFHGDVDTDQLDAYRADEKALLRGSE